jgi:hypothetical protein
LYITLTSAIKVAAHAIGHNYFPAILEAGRGLKQIADQFSGNSKGNYMARRVNPGARMIEYDSRDSEDDYRPRYNDYRRNDNLFRYRLY